MQEVSDAMKISALSEATEVPVATLKYYLREGLLHAGRSLSRTQADYDGSHVERVRLVRALTEVGGLSLATVRRVLDTIESPDVERLGVLGAAQRSLLGEEWVQVDESKEARQAATPSARAWDFLQGRGWQVHPGDPAIADLERAWAACEQAGIGLSAERMGVYADAAEQIAAVDVASVPADPQGAVRQVVLGTVLVDPVLAALRRLAQQHTAVARHAGAAPEARRAAPQTREAVGRTEMPAQE